MGHPNRICTRPRRNSPILHWSSKAISCLKTWRVTYPRDGWVHWLLLRGHRLLYTRRKLRILPNRNRVIGPKQNRIYVSSRTVSIHLHAFGIPIVSGTFQKTTSVILATVKWRLPLVYLDEIVIIPKAPEEHIRYIREVLAFLKNGGVRIRRKKGQLVTEPIEYYGHILLQRRLEIASHTTEAISGVKKPTSRWNLVSSYAYAPFFDDLSQISPNQRSHSKRTTKKVNRKRFWTT